jgi:3-oxoacyl-[acyl-carrier protein] reductase
LEQTKVACEEMMLSLKGKQCVITGATSGIGRGIAEVFASQGANVVVIGTNEERGAEVVAALKDSQITDDQQFRFDKVDVSSKVAVDSLVEELCEVDVLVNCAGITSDKLFMRMGEDDWDRVISVNLKSVYNFSHAVIRSMMKKRWGRIINIASVIGLTGNPGQVNYAASKMGMIGLTKSLAKEVAPRGITVNCIAPGYIETKMTAQVPEKRRDAILAMVPMKKMGKPEDIANAALFLASEMANYITGETIVVDGGMIA